MFYDVFLSWSAFQSLTAAELWRKKLLSCQYGGHLLSWIEKITFLVMWLSLASNLLPCLDMYDFAMIYGDITIFKVAAVCHLDFTKFTVFVTWHMLASYFAWSCKIWLKSNNPLLIYSQNLFSTWWPSTILNCKKIIFRYATIMRFKICYCAPNFAWVIFHREMAI